MEITNRDAEMIVAEIINSMVDSLKTGDEIEIRGFGSFRLRQRNPRNGRNPKTGEAVTVPSKSVVYFKMGKGLKEKFVEK
ncbi:MAG: integration host factor subunit beta [Blastocatellia bacterium]|nr:integration host factor subunit beta [Blastocatellia bacterium]